MVGKWRKLNSYLQAIPKCPRELFSSELIYSRVGKWWKINTYLLAKISYNWNFFYACSSILRQLKLHQESNKLRLQNILVGNQRICLRKNPLKNGPIRTYYGKRTHQPEWWLWDPKITIFLLLAVKSNFRMTQERRGKGRGGVTHPIAKGNQNHFTQMKKYLIFDFCKFLNIRPETLRANTHIWWLIFSLRCTTFPPWLPPRRLAWVFLWNL